MKAGRSEGGEEGRGERKKNRREEETKINPKPSGLASQPSTVLLESEPGGEF